MRIRWAKSPHSDDRQTTSGPIVVTGSIEVPGQPEPLAVSVTVDDLSVTMRTKDMELGSWPVAEVTIRPITPKRFAFEAEGDKLVFTPEDPATLSSHTIVSRGSSAVGARTQPRKRVTKREDAGSPKREEARAPKVEHESPQTTRWLRAIDSARRRGIFDLDRVPVNEALRGQEHRHTFDHGTAASSGLVSHICTICGKVRIRGGRD